MEKGKATNKMCITFKGRQPLYNGRRICLLLMIHIFPNEIKLYIL